MSQEGFDSALEKTVDIMRPVREIDGEMRPTRHFLAGILKCALAPVPAPLELTWTSIVMQWQRCMRMPLPDAQFASTDESAVWTLAD